MSRLNDAVVAEGALKLSADSGPEVTVVVPVFNKEKYLRACLDSIAGQSLGAIEIICIDDGSTDRSPDILDEFASTDRRCRLIRLERNLGAGEARNSGMKAARGKFIRFVDADDLLPARSTQILYERAVKTGADAVRGSIALFRGSNPARPLSIAEAPDREKTSLREERELWIPWWHTAYLVSTELIRDAQLSYPALRRGEDPVFLAGVLTQAARISLLPDVVYYYRKYRKFTGSGASTLKDLSDYLKHAAMVKDLLASYHVECWAEGYGPHLLRDIRRIVRQSRLDSRQLRIVTTEIDRIWNGDRVGGVHS